MSNELAELRKISKILLLVNATKLEGELSKYATTDERKRVWILINEKNTIDDLIQHGGMKRRTVYDFLKVLESAELIECPHGKPPKKLLDFVPASWLNLVKIEEITPEEQSPKETTASSDEQVL